MQYDIMCILRVVSKKYTIIYYMHTIVLVLPMHTVVCRLKVDFADRMRKNIITNLDTLTVRS